MRLRLSEQHCTTVGLFLCASSRFGASVYLAHLDGEAGGQLGELEGVGSRLQRRGSDLARRLEGLCGIPTYYYLYRVGGLGAMVPERKSFIARYGMRAILAGVLANLMSASLAGLFLAL